MFKRLIEAQIKVSSIVKIATQASRIIRIVGENCNIPFIDWVFIKAKDAQGSIRILTSDGMGFKFVDYIVAPRRSHDGVIDFDVCKLGIGFVAKAKKNTKIGFLETTIRPSRRILLTRSIFATKPNLLEEFGHEIRKLVTNYDLSIPVLIWREGDKKILNEPDAWRQHVDPSVASEVEEVIKEVRAYVERRLNDDMVRSEFERFRNELKSLGVFEWVEPALAVDIDGVVVFVTLDSSKQLVLI
ncbi:hypothetical protein Pisl_1549 [Pyrobaculum islandicum DSM 4184]|uniref:Uncharacterized protein n=1 Tax=Pyrobaculum islandicum (strain DSM 4184 / JCM 9189 / GEO3) TaxID=384616 RepID=A1RUS2_PYRIL|nr:hypothetical protein [Pyrobaculum islandicum]ABL88704.1 hypothetical protein Pisl_1549 [Pyrobaculum islandicum DSM 4184]